MRGNIARLLHRRLRIDPQPDGFFHSTILMVGNQPAGIRASIIRIALLSIG